MQVALKLAVIGAGPVGLALALLVASRLPAAHITLFDARAADAPLAGDGRTLALSQGSVQLLQRLGAWPSAAAEPIARVHVSQVPPGRAEVWLSAAEHGLPQLGAVLGYGALVQCLQTQWLQTQAASPRRLHTRMGQAVAEVVAREGRVLVDAGIAEPFDLVVLAEGGLFDQQAPQALHRNHAQRAWAGTVRLAAPHEGVAYERFTREGPLALLPLPNGAGGLPQASLVWCVSDVQEAPHAGAAQGPTSEPAGSAQPSLELLNALLPAAAPRVAALGALARFKLGLNAHASLVQGRTVRIGNAAQTLHPVAGQGLNLGLRDAWSLVESLHHARDLDAALGRISWVRGADRFSLIATTELLARAFTVRSPLVAGARNLALAALQAAPPLKRALTRHLVFGWR